MPNLAKSPSAPMAQSTLLAPSNFLSNKEKINRYYEAQKIICPYEDCKKVFNRIICEICSQVNIFEGGYYFMQIILLKDKGIIQRILKVIYGEFDYNILCLTQAIKGQKQNSFFFNSAIIKNEFNILSQIMQNVKLIEYMINGAFKKIINDKIEEVNTSENNNNYNNDSIE